MNKTLYLLSLLFFSSTISIAQTSNPDKYKYDFVVAKYGSGDYNYIQDAIDTMRVFPLQPITLYIKNGVYTEKVELPRYNVDVTFIGESVDKTIITYNDYAGRGQPIGTFNSYTIKISGNRFKAENITFENSAGAVEQAVALHVEADKAIFKNCTIHCKKDSYITAPNTPKDKAYGFVFLDCKITTANNVT